MDVGVLDDLLPTNLSRRLYDLQMTGVNASEVLRRLNRVPSSRFSIVFLTSSEILFHVVRL